MAPEGASRCRAVASGLLDRSAGSRFSSWRERAEPMDGGWQSQGSGWFSFKRNSNWFRFAKMLNQSSSRPTTAKRRAGTHDHRPVVMGPRFREDDGTQRAARLAGNFHDVKQPTRLR
jgi:hypothetical protein